MGENGENKDSDKSKNEMEKLSDKLLSQLHEQYAINDNDKSQNFITFLIAIFALLGAYGYVYVHTYVGDNLNNIFKNVKISTVDCCNNNELYFHPDVLIYLTVLISLVMLFLSVLVIILGYSTRRDHIMIHRIREYAFEGELHKSLFKNNLFNPLGKTMCDFLPDYYKSFFGTFQFINWVALGFTYQLLSSVHFKCICFWSVFAVSVISIFILCEYYCKYCNYTDCEKEHTLKNDKLTCKYILKVGLLFFDFKKICNK